MSPSPYPVILIVFWALFAVLSVVAFVVALFVGGGSDEILPPGGTDPGAPQDTRAPSPRAVARPWPSPVESGCRPVTSRSADRPMSPGPQALRVSPARTHARVMTTTSPTRHDPVIQADVKDELA